MNKILNIEEGRHRSCYVFTFRSIENVVLPEEKSGIDKMVNEVLTIVDLQQRLEELVAQNYRLYSYIRECTKVYYFDEKGVRYECTLDKQAPIKDEPKVTTVSPAMLHAEFEEIIRNYDRDAIIDYTDADTVAQFRRYAQIRTGEQDPDLGL